MNKLLLTVALIVPEPLFANDFANFYKPIPAGSVPIARWQGDPDARPSNGDPRATVSYYWEQGYSPFGYSVFNGPMRKEKDALKYAKSIGAHFIVVMSQHTGTRQGAMTTPLFGSLVTTPLVQERYDQIIFYFGDVAHEGAGILRDELTDQQKSQIGSNKGFVVRAIRKGSPGYEANLVPGDLVETANGKPADADDLVALALSSPTPIKVGFLRNGLLKETDFSIPEAWR